MKICLRLVNGWSPWFKVKRGTTECPACHAPLWEGPPGIYCDSVHALFDCEGCGATGRDLPGKCDSCLGLNP